MWPWDLLANALSLQGWSVSESPLLFMESPKSHADFRGVIGMRSITSCKACVLHKSTHPSCPMLSNQGDGDWCFIFLEGPKYRLCYELPPQEDVSQNYSKVTKCRSAIEEHSVQASSLKRKAVNPVPFPCYFNLFSNSPLPTLIDSLWCNEFHISNTLCKIASLHILSIPFAHRLESVPPW